MEDERYEQHQRAKTYFAPIRDANQQVSAVAGDQHKEIIQDILSKF